MGGINFHDTIALDVTANDQRSTQGGNLQANKFQVSGLRRARTVVAGIFMYWIASSSSAQPAAATSGHFQSKTESQTSLMSELSELENPTRQLASHLISRFNSMDALFQETTSTEFESQLEASDFEITWLERHPDKNLLWYASLLFEQRSYTNTSTLQTGNGRLKSTSYQDFSTRTAELGAEFETLASLWLSVRLSWNQTRQSSQSLFGSSSGRVSYLRSGLGLTIAEPDWWFRLSYQPQVHLQEEGVSVRRAELWQAQAAVLLGSEALAGMILTREQRSKLDDDLQPRDQYDIVGEYRLLPQVLGLLSFGYRPSSVPKNASIGFDNIAYQTMKLGLDLRAYEDASIAVSWQFIEGTDSESATNRKLSILVHTAELVTTYWF